ncbi:MAG TPA: energy transducer TonB [Thermoanaerobaculia bacterium]|nr:energy transducer TonB [Thermoanaerobaculia bacterium]
MHIALAFLLLAATGDGIDGRVSGGGRVLKPLPHGLSASAINAVRQWRYAPARNDRGQPVRALVTIDLPFRPGS